MSGVFRTIDPGHSCLVERGWGVNSSEDARDCSVLYICKYFVVSGVYKCTDMEDNTFGSLSIPIGFEPGLHDGSTHIPFTIKTMSIRIVHILYRKSNLWVPQKLNQAASFPVFTFICERFIYFSGSVCLFGFSKIGRRILEIYKLLTNT
jgi:hypothetical protein